MSAAGTRLTEWVDRQPVRSDRFWTLVARDLYRCAVQLGRAGCYLDGADLDGLVWRTVALARLGPLHPADLLYLPQISWAARQRTDRPLTGEAYDDLAAALNAALVEHGVPSDLRRCLRADIDRARTQIIAPVRPHGHPYLWPRPGRRSLVRS